MEKLKNKSKICAFCKKEFKYKIKPGPDPKYCSKKCRRNADKINAKTRYTKTCKHCGEKYKTSNKKQKYCSITCAGKDKRTIKGTTRKCKVCGKKFQPNYKEQKTCSQQCGSIAAAKTMGENGIYDKLVLNPDSPLEGKYKDPDRKRICKNCGKEFYANSIYQKDRKFCSRKCFLDFIDAEEGSTKGRFTDWSQRKRAKEYGVEFEKINIEKIYERDKWTCQICGEKVDNSLTWPNPMSATIDHIIPLSKGGTHTKDNVQLAHASCNISKSDKLINY